MKLDKMMMVGALVAGMSMASSVMAGYQITVGYPGSGYGKWQTGDGGEFTVQPNAELTAAMFGLNPYSTFTKDIGKTPSFQTFCMELPERLGSYNSTYNVVLNSKAINGGNDAYLYSPPGDPLSKGSAWLYSQFAKGMLVGYDYANVTVAGRKGSADKLQKILWALEGEDYMSVATFSSDPFGAQVISKFGSIAAAKTDAGMNNYGVGIMNLTTAKGERAQDLLFYIPDAGTTLALMGIAFTGLGMFGRKYRK